VPTIHVLPAALSILDPRALHLVSRYCQSRSPSLKKKRCNINKRLSLGLLYRRISFFSPSISRTFTHARSSSSKRYLHVFPFLPCMPSTGSISQSSRRIIPPKLSLSSLVALGDPNREQCCLGNYVASEAAGSNAEDPSWLELVPWRNKQLAARIGVHLSPPIATAESIWCFQLSKQEESGG
jgi:hypothetical protein